MEETENDVGSLEQILLYADEHYLAGKLPPGRPFRKRSYMGSKNIINVTLGPLRFNASQKWTGYHAVAKSPVLKRVHGKALGFKTASYKGVWKLWNNFTSASARIVERVTVGSTSACRTILRSSLSWSSWLLQTRFSARGTFSCPLLPSNFLTAHSERSTWPATRSVDKPAVFPDDQALSNSLNSEKCLLHRLPGMFRLQKFSLQSAGNRHVYESSNLLLM
ncbi:uncharacterized protein TNCV_5027081 [Trichonephila clavipes]|nr:uncharacterized protein TNCV_5027081 [Trichonephila clavipes]